MSASSGRNTFYSVCFYTMLFRNGNGVSSHRVVLLEKKLCNTSVKNLCRCWPVEPHLTRDARPSEVLHASAELRKAISITCHRVTQVIRAEENMNNVLRQGVRLTPTITENRPRLQ